MKTTAIRVIITVLVISGIMVQFSCKRSGETRKDASFTEPEVKEAVETRVREFVYPLPTSYEAIQMLNDLGAAYIIGLSNSYKNVDKYFTENSKALNLGVYGADLSYASTYQMKQETMYFLEASKKLTDDLGISGIINEQLLNDVESNIDNREKLIEIITNTFFDTYDFLNRNGRGNLALLILAGTWTEALYISTHISANVYNNYKIVKIIHQQKASIDKLYEMLELSKEDAYIKEVMQDLLPLKTIYDALDGSFTEAQVIAISAEVEKVRTKFVS